MRVERAPIQREPSKDPVTKFFAELAAAGHVPTFERNSATVRFDVLDDAVATSANGASSAAGQSAGRSGRAGRARGAAGAPGNGGTSAGGPGGGQATERWYVAVTNGDVMISRRNGSADAVVRIERQCLESLVTGRLNAQAAYLRGLFSCEGSMAAVIMFQRCLPGPPGSTGRIAPLTSAQVMAERRAG